MNSGSGRLFDDFGSVREYRTSPERREQSRRYHDANRDREREQQRQYREANRGRIRERNRRYYEANRDRLRETRRRYSDDRIRHGISRQQRAALLAAQGGLCAVCREPGPTNLDHNHDCCPRGQSCGCCIRGILCSGCNAAEGHARTRPDLLQPTPKLQRYLDRGHARWLPDGRVVFVQPDDPKGSA